MSWASSMPGCMTCAYAADRSDAALCDGSARALVNPSSTRARNVCRHAFPETFESIRPIHLVEMDVEDRERAAIAPGLGKRSLELVLRPHFGAPSAAEQLGHAVIGPVVNVVVGTFVNEPFGRVALV